MKLHYILIQVMSLLIYSSSFSQEQLMQEEITLYVEGFTSSPTVTYTLEAVGTVWANSTISTSYNTVEEVVTGNTTFSMHYGWRIFWEPAPHEPFAHGFYKLKTNINTNYVYLDLRDCQYANQSYTPGYSTTDFALKYNGLTDEFSYKNNQDSTYTTILPKAVVRIGDIKNGNAVTTCFDNYWSNCLIIIPSQTGNNPKLVCGPYPSSSITIQAYKVYRKVGSGNFSLIHTNNESQFEYTDTDYYIPTSGGSQLQYYIKALFVTEELSQPTNTVTTNGIITLKGKSNTSTFVDKNILLPNFPNPFNPTTKISYSIKEEGLVTLKVYDILGKEIATLVNENKPTGNYEAEFNASSLPSGIYLYRIQAGNFVQTRKMILMK